MKLFVLSELNPKNNHVGWSVSHSLEAALASACDATFIYPSLNDRSEGLREYPVVGNPMARIERYKHRLLKSWFGVEERPTLGKGPNVLLVVGLGPFFLLSMHALGPLLNQFDLRLGYVLDGFDPRYLDRSLTSCLDQLFVINADVVDDINQRGFNSTFLPLATDTFNARLTQQNRWIDIMSYGRGRSNLHQCLQAHYNQQNSDRVYYHSTFSRPEVANPREHILLLSKLLNRSKISVCCEASDIPRFMGHSPILYRWFEAWAAGCTIVGKRPFGRGVAELMDWENSTIELSDSPSDWIPCFEALLNDPETLTANSLRNYRECLLRHDWRYRLQDMFNRVDLPTPSPLNEQIAQLRERAAEAASGLVLA